MSPFPAKFSRETLISHARQMIETNGIEQLTLKALAERLSAQAPSIYNYFANKQALLKAVNEQTMVEITASMLHVQQSATADLYADLLEMAQAYRQYALQHPRCYGLVFADNQPAAQIDPALAEKLAIPLQTAIARLVGPEQSIAALRGSWALIHGFTILELNDQFKRQGDSDADFIRAFDAYLRGWSRGLNE
jgi:AcrR family transcriptional regulator